MMYTMELFKRYYERSRHVIRLHPPSSYSWSVPEMFPDPEAFKPERFIDTTSPRLKNFDLPFGFGRRSCPGIHLARNSLFINIARLLWGFQIKPALDEKGNEIIPDCNAYTNGFNSRPVSFPCRFIPRSPKITLCIETEWKAVQPRLEVSL
ncbi:hypothetical protein D9619_000271 [Psilocybe cf. subviscida]|uniref:Cytochrome P450 n=1 Tax=Psilocybe cf. subviscida TaxID=2480587 RepID=A0A8H5F2N4_9AGAR|nr:hypothetical protein D9619_000271 [Psilocybe cf. subviscida]